MDSALFGDSRIMHFSIFMFDFLGLPMFHCLRFGLGTHINLNGFVKDASFGTPLNLDSSN